MSENQQKLNNIQFLQKLSNESENQETSKIIESCGIFLKTIKKFKRKLDNNLKFNERDIDAFRRRYENTTKQLIPLIHDIKINVIERMIKFDIKQLKNQNFQMHLYTNKELCELSFKIFDYDATYLDYLSQDQMKKLIKTLCLNYNVVPYHNWTHAFSVFQMFFCCYQNSDINYFFQQKIVYIAGYLQSIFNLLNKEGLNNLYKIKRKSNICINYAEQGVLENMHCSQLFNIILNDQEINFFQKFSDQVKIKLKRQYYLQKKYKIQQFKRIVITSILATDIAKHQKLHTKFKKRSTSTLKLQKIKSEQEKNAASDLDKYLKFNNDNFEDRRFILNIITHACDIGNPCLQFNNYLNWSYLITQEFMDQADKEKQNNLPVTTFLIYKDKLTFLNGQLFFVSKNIFFNKQNIYFNVQKKESIVLPLWEDIAELFKELKEYPEQIKNNLIEIELQRDKIQQQKLNA
ncbi:phosphodiesterase 9a, putative [Ichthyophthirius multifiliis]|uniref:Phosphodiesterase 9a, putative n=1 Tax=Ichthyophthirius multifiliis TaxID=5932 RepID=G0QZ61_ICHMU|nr:phosphodiesterase 9a, putative [Ichthyophthirius multifiliis]EGR29484.1 phosphodiesterase 9a, putative [Ichthyophthirius multifiliis]|eukprot:XP_004030720.1 phosphodiesterase 9a, putative [Ichthyophthirius multifiliis]